jgi:DNA helicase-2/ATP-dependent DNA helicase PcrA
MNIPYRIYGGMSFYQRKEIKDVIAYFRLVTNHNDEEALKRIINYPTRGIGDTTVQKIVAKATEHGASLWEVMSNPARYQLDVAKATANKIEAFRQLVIGWGSRSVTEDAYQLGHAIIMESGVSKDIYSSRNPEDIARQENLEEFLGGMQDFVESRREEDMGNHVLLSDFLQEVALLTDLDSEGDENQPKVSLMTIHSAKGLEFPTVFVVGLEENIFPSPMCTESMRELEEERRLLYVAITRAEKHCILTCAQNRFRYGRMEYDTPSRFIRDIDPSLLYIAGEKKSDDADYGTKRLPWTQNPRPVATQFRADPMPRAVAPRRQEQPVEALSPSFKRLLNQSAGGQYRPAATAPRASQQNGSAAPSSSALHEGATTGHQLREGMTIEHQRFGIGTVLKVEGSGENEKATVNFRNVGTKQLLLKFAKYKII